VRRGIRSSGEVRNAHVVSSAAPFTQDATRTQRVYAWSLALPQWPSGLAVAAIRPSLHAANVLQRSTIQTIRLEVKPCRFAARQRTLINGMFSPLSTGIYAGISAAGALGLLAGGCAYAAIWPSSQLFGRTLIAPRRPTELALTFDDGPNPAWTPQLLDILAKHHVRATFFLVGRYAQAQRELVRRMVDAGHLIGNHSWSHPNLALTSAARVRNELRQTSETLEQITGQPVRFFRPPFGGRRPLVLQTARLFGLTPVTWNAMTTDWSEPSSEKIAQRLIHKIDRVTAGGYAANIVLHDGGHLAQSANRGPSVAAANALLQRFKGSYQFIALDEWHQ
jgi:peptidoglycan/xylan/chitin deacetylase (PgdA/CDA1 family)